MSGSILDRFRAGRNAKEKQFTAAANDFSVSRLQAKIKSVIPGFLRPGSTK